MSRPHQLSHVMQRMFNQPLALHPSYGAMLVAAASNRLGIESLELAAGEFRYPGVQPGAKGTALDRELMTMLADDGKKSAEKRLDKNERQRKLFDHSENVAIIPVEGTLTKTWGLNPSSGFTGYDGIETKLIAAQSDKDVKGIWMQFDSGGGDVSGLFPLVDLLSAMTVRNGGKKPIYAMISDYAYSAAYALASACDKIFIPETGGAGSVGVITMHADYGEAYEKQGVNVTVIRSGERKAKPHPLEPLEATDLERIQGQIDRIRTMFVARVAANRGIPESRVSKTEAVDYMGADAKAIGFVDKIATEHQAWGALQKAIA